MCSWLSHADNNCVFLSAIPFRWDSYPSMCGSDLHCRLQLCKQSICASNQFVLTIKRSRWTSRDSKDVLKHRGSGGSVLTIKQKLVLWQRLLWWQKWCLCHRQQCTMWSVGPHWTPNCCPVSGVWLNYNQWYFYIYSNILVILTKKIVTFRSNILFQWFNIFDRIMQWNHPYNYSTFSVYTRTR